MQTVERLLTAFALTLSVSAFCACSQEPPASAANKTEAAPSKASTPSAPAPELAVYAAASTRDALQALEKPYESAHRVDLVFNFGSSGDLSKQIVAAARADVFLSADEKEMDKLNDAKLVAADTRHSLLSNQLVVIEPKDAPSIFTEPFTPAQLADPKDKKLSLANVESVPAGRYAKAWLDKVGVWKDVSDRIVPAVDVRAALAAVESGGVQAGIVYRTDVSHSTHARIVYAVPLAEGPKISYPVAAIAARPNEKAAREFVEFLSSAEARAAFEHEGFLIQTAASPASK